MTLTTKAVLVVGLLLSSAQAWARKNAVLANEGFRAPELHTGALSLSAALAYRSTGYEQPRRHWSMPSAASARNSGSEDRLRSRQGKRHVDVMSLSLGGALACFFALAFLRRRKSKRASASESLPTARVLRSEDLRDSHGDQ